MVKRKKKGAAVVTLSSVPDVAPSSSLPPPPSPHPKTTQKQAISNLQQDNAALRNKMDAIDNNYLWLCVASVWTESEGQKEGTAMETPPELRLPTDQAPSQGEDEALTRSGGD